MPLLTGPVGFERTSVSNDVGNRAEAGARPDAAASGAAQQAFERRLAFESVTRVEPRRTPLATSTAKQAIADAFHQLTGTPLNESAQAILTAQWAHETGHGASMYNFNFGGIKGVGPSGLTVTQRTREGYGAHERRISDQFRAYSSPEEGAKDYVQLLLTRYSKAVAAAERGDAAGFVQGLKDKGYFTGDPTAYRNSIVAIAQQVADVPGTLLETGATGLEPSPAEALAVDTRVSRTAPRPAVEWERPLMPTALLGTSPAGQDSSLDGLMALSSTSAIQMSDEVTRAALRLAINERDERDSSDRLSS